DKPPFAVMRTWSECAIVSGCLGMNLSYIYQQYVAPQTWLCAWGYAGPRGEYSEECHFGPDSITVTYVDLQNDERVNIKIPYERAVVFETCGADIHLLKSLRYYQPSDSKAVYKPDQLIEQGDPPPRVYSIFPRWPYRATPVPR